MTEHSAVMDTPLGAIDVSWRGDVLTGVNLESEGFPDGRSRVPNALAAQLDAYFRDGSTVFDLELDLRGTPFQLRVWEALRRVPAGRTLTYGELARRLRTSPRAVGGACRHNPCPIVVPCHRVVGATGLGGFAGDTSGRRLDVKRWLLRHEGNARF